MLVDSDRGQNAECRTRSSTAALTLEDSPQIYLEYPRSRLIEKMSFQAVEKNLESFCRSSPCENVKLVVSSAIVSLLLLVLVVCVSLTYCVLKLHPALNFLLLFCAITLLAYVEALHYSVVSIEKWDMVRSST
jgi:hypothetical protein